MSKPKSKKPAALVLNDAAPVVGTKPTLQHFTFNAKTKLVRNDKMEGKPFKVVPMVMIVEGVLNGSQGPLYYPAEELGKRVAVWNHKPVVVYHPTINGQGVSACDPAIIDQYKIGVIMNTKFDKLNRLTAEAWIDEDRANAVDKRVMEAVNNGETLELSTGVFTDNEMTPGEFEGEKYDAIARNYGPDHLAILPDKVGACSIEDGAGFIRNELGQKFPKDMQDILGSAVLATLRTLGISDITANEMSLSNISSQMYGLLRAKLVPKSTKEYVDIWVCDVYTDFCVYQYMGKLFKQSFTTSGTKVELEGEPSEVVRVTEYRTTDGTFVGNHQTNNSKDIMNKKEVIDGLIGNAASGWKESDREFLMGLPDERLKTIATNAAAIKPTVENKPAPAANAAPTAPKVEDLLNNEQIAALNYGKRMLAEKKSQLIGQITANKANVFTAEVLNGKSIEELEGIAALAAVPAAPAAPAPTPWFGGQAQPAANGKADDNEEVLSLPVMNFEKASADAK